MRLACINKLCIVVGMCVYMHVNRTNTKVQKVIVIFSIKTLTIRAQISNLSVFHVLYITGVPKKSTPV